MFKATKRKTPQNIKGLSDCITTSCRKWEENRRKQLFFVGSVALALRTLDVYNVSVGMDVLVEFMEVAIHCILYNRNLYPQGVFEKRMKYNIPVQRCLHPEVNNYISSLMESLKLLLSKGRVRKVSVVILQEENGIPVERFVFDVGDCRNEWAELDPHLFQAEQALRGVLLKLNVSDGLLRTPLNEVTWTLHIHTQESTLLAVEEQLVQQDFPWAEADEKEKCLKNAKLIPLRDMTSHVFDMHLYVEEADIS